MSDDAKRLAEVEAELRTVKQRLDGLEQSLKVVVDELNRRARSPNQPGRQIHYRRI